MSPFPSHSNSSSVFTILEDKETEVIIRGWLTGTFDRQLRSPHLADLRSDHSLRNCVGAALWLPATETQSVDQTSVFLRRAHRKLAKETGGKQGFTPVIIIMPWDVPLWISVCVCACVSCHVPR